MSERLSESQPRLSQDWAALGPIRNPTEHVGEFKHYVFHGFPANQRRARNALKTTRTEVSLFLWKKVLLCLGRSYFRRRLPPTVQNLSKNTPTCPNAPQEEEKLQPEE
jgi:hypothetical protein